MISEQTINIVVSPATVDERPILRRLMELYQYDFSEFDQADISPMGVYDYPYFDHYWVEAGRTPFLVRVDGKLAGFVFVSRYNFRTGKEDGWVMAEFFIMRKYRLQGVGEHVARWVFDHHPGAWQVSQIPENKAATIFWRKVIARYTHDHYEEFTLDNEHWHGLVQSFTAFAEQTPGG